MAGFNNSWWEQMPPVTKNLLLINFVVWVFDAMALRFGADMVGWLGLINWSAAAFHGKYSFHIWQLVTYMFMHDGFWHIFCNMFAVMMFGPMIEQQWGSKKFLTYYMVTGIGAGLVQELVWMFTAGSAMAVTVGASGAVFCLLFAVAILVFHHVNSRSLIDAIYTIVSYTYGPLLGLFAFGLFTRWQVRGRWVPLVCVLSPLMCSAESTISEQLWDYRFGYELLLLNGLLTFVGLRGVTTTSHCR